jgi:hypothetical protein
MKFDIILYFNKKTDQSLDYWIVNFEGNKKLNFIKQFQNGMIELKTMMKNIEKEKDFDSFWKIVFKIDGKNISAVKSQSYLSNQEYVYLEYVYGFNWKNLNDYEMSVILINSYNKLFSSLSSTLQKEINTYCKLVNLESDNLMNLKKFTTFKSTLNLKEDPLVVKKVNYTTPIKYRNK